MARTQKSGTLAVVFGKRVRERRVLLGLNQTEVARRAKTTTGNLSELERAIAGRGPTLSMVERVAKALGVPAAELLS